MRQINFGLIFSFGLITVFFTLANTNATTVHVLPGMEYTLPLAGLLLLVAGFGAVAAWFFAAWTGMLNNVDQFSKRAAFAASTRLASASSIARFATSKARARSSRASLAMFFVATK